MESDEDDPIPSTSSAIPKARTKKRVFSEYQKLRKREMDRQRLALKLKVNPDEFKKKMKARVRSTRAHQMLANPEEFREKTNASKQRTRSRQMSYVAAKDGLKNFDIIRGTFVIQRLSDTKDAVGFMDKKCVHCGALRFKGETKGSCCSSGKVLPEPFPRPPEEIMKLWNSNEGLGRVLKTFSREINNAFALSSVQVKIKRFPGFNPSVIFQGKVIHQTGPLIPKEGEVPKFSQLYLCDPNLENSQRFQHMVLPERISSKDKNNLKKLLSILQGEIHRANHYIKDLLMIMEIPDDELAQGKIIISAKAKPKEDHARRYNLPTSLHEVFILTDNQPNDIVLRKRGGGLKRISDLNPKAMPLHFTLLFPYGNYGWNQQASRVQKVCNPLEPSRTFENLIKPSRTF